MLTGLSQVTVQVFCLLHAPAKIKKGGCFRVLTEMLSFSVFLLFFFAIMAFRYKKIQKHTEKEREQNKTKKCIYRT